MSDQGPKPTTHFGFKEVPMSDKVSQVAGVFHSVAAKYDVMNDLMSMGIHRLWKRQTIEMSGVRVGDSVLDLAGGTGDLTMRFSELVGPEGHVILADINESMIKVGRDRLIDKGVVGNVSYVQANAEALPFPDDSFDCITIAFGLRNVTHKEDALRSMLRVLKPGGRAVILEFATPLNSFFRAVYHFYFLRVLPCLGGLLSQRSAYQYLPDSVMEFPDRESLKAMMEAAGFVDVKIHDLTGGIAAVHVGTKG